ncbi:MAG TPA: antibiotic biosynthesis monooxygenase [Stellaceae bacterium]|nr:antibiotic biosynthesis monooxygenase [Stellaceae bacterium]
MRSFGILLLAAAPIVAAFVGAATAQEAGAVYVVTYVDVQAKEAKEGAALIKRYREESRKEGGNLWMAAGEEIGRPNRFIVLEAWRDQGAFDAHKSSAPAKSFGDKIAAIRHSPSDQRVNHAFAVASAPPPHGALYVETHVDVPPPRREAAEAALRQMAADTAKDPGNLRYDVFQQAPPVLNHFNVFAIWQSREALAAHEMTAHRQQFRDTLAPMLGALYDERIYKPI